MKDFLYDLDKNTHEIKLTKYVGSDHEVIIPDYIDHYPVTRIGVNAFGECESMINITLPQTLKIIDADAFTFCTNLQKIVLPSSLQKIEASAFYQCEKLQSIEMENNDYLMVIDNVIYNKEMTKLIYYLPFKDIKTFIIPDSVVSIKDSAFYDAIHLEEVILPSHLIHIESYAFSGCTHLKDIAFPETVRTIGNGAFEACRDLRTVILPKHLQTLGNSAFNQCDMLEAFIIDEDNPHYTTIDGVLYTKDLQKLVRYPIFPLHDTFSVPDFVKEIGTYAFRDCFNLKEVVLSNNIEKMNNYAFEGSSIIKITIPDKVKIIAQATFNDCYNLKEVVLPNSIEMIQEYAFSSCNKLKNIVLPKSLVFIAETAFNNCDTDMIFYVDDESYAFDYVWKHNLLYDLRIISLKQKYLIN